MTSSEDIFIHWKLWHAEFLLVLFFVCFACFPFGASSRLLMNKVKNRLEGVLPFWHSAKWDGNLHDADSSATVTKALDCRTEEVPTAEKKTVSLHGQSGCAHYPTPVFPYNFITLTRYINTSPHLRSTPKPGTPDISYDTATQQVIQQVSTGSDPAT